MSSLDVGAFTNKTNAKKDWSSADFASFCREAVELAKKHPRDRSELAYWIVEIGRYFGDFNSVDADPIRQQIKELAADLELPDEHIDTSDGLNVDQKWQRLGMLVGKPMTKKSDELWEQIYPTTHSPRELLVAYVKELTNEAKSLPQKEREARGDYTDQASRFPQTKGEEIANDITHALAMQDWIDMDTADDLEEILSISGNLEISPEDHLLWQELFEKVDKLA